MRIGFERRGGGHVGALRGARYAAHEAVAGGSECRGRKRPRAGIRVGVDAEALARGGVFVAAPYEVGILLGQDVAFRHGHLRAESPADRLGDMGLVVDRGVLRGAVAFGQLEYAHQVFAVGVEVGGERLLRGAAQCHLDLGPHAHVVLRRCRRFGGRGVDLHVQNVAVPGHHVGESAGHDPQDVEKGLLLIDVGHGRPEAGAQRVAHGSGPLRLSAHDDQLVGGAERGVAPGGRERTECVAARECEGRGEQKKQTVCWFHGHVLLFAARYEKKREGGRRAACFLSVTDLFVIFAGGRPFREHARVRAARRRAADCGRGAAPLIRKTTTCDSNRRKSSVV